jgi:catechol 2,3-dioxygenase-like lactoylglutathione lyase family enzyme
VAVKLDAIVFDCADAAPLARFWAAVLGWQVAPYEEDELARLAAAGVDDPEDDPSVMVEPPADSRLPVLFFTEVPEEKAVKNRLHLDVTAESSIAAEVERLEALGASLRNWAEGGGTTWVVMLDPEGSEFCIMPPED